MGLGYYINKAIRGIKKNGALVSPDENGIVTISADASVVCDISDGVIGFRAKLFSVLDSTKSLQIAPIYFRQETNDHQELLLPMVKFSYTDDDNFSASFEITGTKTNIRLDVVVDGGDWLPLLSETVDEVVLFTEEERVKLLGISDNANDNVIEEIQVNGTPLIPDANKSVNIVMSGGGSGESNVIETVKVNGTPLVPDANKAVDVITVNYITQDMTAAEIMAVVNRCINAESALTSPIYLHRDDCFYRLAYFFYNDTSSAELIFYIAETYQQIDILVANGEVTISQEYIFPTPTNIGAAEAIHTHTGYAATAHTHTGIYQPTISGKGLSTNDYTTAEKNKLSGIATGAQANVIETVKVNGTALTVTNKGVDISAYANGMSAYDGTLAADGRYYGSFTTSPTFEFTAPTNANADHTIILYATFAEGATTVVWNNQSSLMFYNGTIPTIEAGNYDIIATWHPAAEKWSVGVLKTGTVSA